MSNAAAKPKVGFIGLGIMGQPMALNLLKAGFELTVYNRTAEKARPVVEAGAVQVYSPKEVAQNSDIIITIVTGPDDVKEVILGPNGVAEGARPGSIVVDMSTISPKVAREVHAALAEKGIGMLDAPVSGGDTGAKAGTLSIMVGGDAELVEKCRGVFEAMGKKITHVGGPGMGQLTKLVNQVLVALNLMATCEALTFAAKAGADLEKVLEAVSGGAAGSWQLSNLGPKMVEGDYRPGFMVKLLQKDLKLALEESDLLHVPLLGTSLVHQLLRKAEDAGWGDEGTQALVKVLEELAGTRVAK